MIVKFLKDHEPHEAGDVVQMPDVQIEALVQAGICELVEPKPESKPPYVEPAAFKKARKVSKVSKQ